MSDTSPGKHEDKHWLVRPKTIRGLWISAILVLLIVTLFDIWVKKYVYFGLEGTFGFYSWYGFLSAVTMVLIARAVGLFIKREDTYYDDPD